MKRKVVDGEPASDDSACKKPKSGVPESSLTLGALLGQGSYGAVFEVWPPHCVDVGGASWALKLLDPPPLELLTKGLHVSLRPVEGKDIESVPVLLMAAREHAEHDVCTARVGPYKMLGYTMPRQTPLTPAYYATLHVDERYTLGRRLVNALGALHARGLVHGDVKCANVLLAKDGSPSWCDFSLLHTAPYWPSTAYSSLMYAESHQPPEVGLAVTPACDMYALGIMLAALELGLSDDEALTLNKTVQSLTLRCAYITKSSRQQEADPGSSGVKYAQRILCVLHSLGAKTGRQPDDAMLRVISLMLPPKPEHRVCSSVLMDRARLAFSAAEEGREEGAREEDPPPPYLSPVQVQHVECYIQEHVARKAREARAMTMVNHADRHSLPRQWEVDNLRAAMRRVFMRYASRVRLTSREDVLHGLCACMCLASACCTLDERLVFSDTDFVGNPDMLSALELNEAAARVFNALRGGGLMAPAIGSLP